MLWQHSVHRIPILPDDASPETHAYEEEYPENTERNRRFMHIPCRNLNAFH